MPMIFVQNPLRLADELGFSGIRPDEKPRPKPGDPLSPEEVRAYLMRPRAESQHDQQKARRRRKSRRIREART